MKRQNVRTLSLIVGTFTYLLLGAAVFDAFESNFEVDEEKRLRELAIEWRRKYNMSEDDFDQITQVGIQMKPYKAGTQWKFAGAFYFATTVVTTIGYGHSTPKTTWGKIFCMCYAVPGIPLCLVMFQSIGERMNTIITWILRQVKKLLSCKCRSVSQTNLMLVSFTTGATVLTLGAAVFSRYEDWTYLNAFYYCFITLTTIGFGDFVALQRNDSLAKRPDYVAFSLIFILFGLTVVSSVMNLLVLRFLTMNTEDERRDQLEAQAQAQELLRLRGGILWTEEPNESVYKSPRYRQPIYSEIPALRHPHATYPSLNRNTVRGWSRFVDGVTSLFAQNPPRLIQTDSSKLFPLSHVQSHINDYATVGVAPRRMRRMIPRIPDPVLLQSHSLPDMHRTLSIPDFKTSQSTDCVIKPSSRQDPYYTGFVYAELDPNLTYQSTHRPRYRGREIDHPFTNHIPCQYIHNPHTSQYKVPTHPEVSHYPSSFREQYWPLEQVPLSIPEDYYQVAPDWQWQPSGFAYPSHPLTETTHMGPMGDVIAYDYLTGNPIDSDRDQLLPIDNEMEADVRWTTPRSLRKRVSV